jgi:hypothetical protein
MADSERDGLKNVGHKPQMDNYPTGLHCGHHESFKTYTIRNY